jgi:1-acyl-sn-glycerol-3-phosphate acyltransferase
MILTFLRLVFAVLYTLFISAMILLIVPITRNERYFHFLARMHAKGILGTCGISIRVEGLENIDFSHSHIYVSNHASFFDIPAVIAAIPDQIRIVYKKELEKVPIFGWGLKFGKTYIAIDRKRGQDALQSLDEAAGKIRDGASVLLFAEGTRTADGTLQPFKRGPFYLAVRSGVPIIPVAIKGSYRVLPRHSYRITPGVITVVVHKEIPAPLSHEREAEMALRSSVHKVLEKTLSTT